MKREVIAFVLSLGFDRTIPAEKARSGSRRIHIITYLHITTFETLKAII